MFMSKYFVSQLRQKTEVVDIVRRTKTSPPYAGIEDRTKLIVTFLEDRKQVANT